VSSSGPIGGYLHAEGDIEINAGRPVTTLEVVNTGDRPIQVGSHHHFAETNRALRFDRMTAYGQRLDIPAGTSVRFEPGARRTVALVPFGGARILTGGLGLVGGALDDPSIRAGFEARLRQAGLLPPAATTDPATAEPDG
jgi:urease beta subunit